MRICCNPLFLVKLLEACSADVAQGKVHEHKSIDLLLTGCVLAEDDEVCQVVGFV
eukprot:m.451370 g.451370  ORF g.451370 m.451370 type:complete len:55 (+) comp20324_c2_seq5:1185-1349(+)